MLPYIRGLMIVVVALALVPPGAAMGEAQTPKPFPSPGQSAVGQAPPAPAPPPPAMQQPAPAAQTPEPPPVRSASELTAPTEAMLGAPVYPGAVYLGSYDAGRGQRFHLFGVLLSFADAVTYYRATMKKNGDVLYQSPPTHQFETERFREDTMAFPPSVTVKDYTSGGGAGYANPTPGATPTHFPTIIQIVPPPASPQ